MTDSELIVGQIWMWGMTLTCLPWFILFHDHEVRRPNGDPWFGLLMTILATIFWPWAVVYLLLKKINGSQA